MLIRGLSPKLESDNIKIGKENRGVDNKNLIRKYFLGQGAIQRMLSKILSGKACQVAGRLNYILSRFHCKMSLDEWEKTIGSGAKTKLSKMNLVLRAVYLARHVRLQGV